MKTAVIFLIIITVIFLVGVLVFAALAGAAATKSALEQAYDDLEQEKYIAEWKQTHRKKKHPCTMHKSGSDSVVQNGEEAE